MNCNQLSGDGRLYVSSQPTSEEPKCDFSGSIDITLGKADPIYIEMFAHIKNTSQGYKYDLFMGGQKGSMAKNVNKLDNNSPDYLGTIGNTGKVRVFAWKREDDGPYLYVLIQDCN